MLSAADTASASAVAQCQGWVLFGHGGILGRQVGTRFVEPQVGRQVGNRPPGRQPNRESSETKRGRKGLPRPVQDRVLT